MPASESLSRTLSAAPSAVGEARALVREFLGAMVRAQDAELIVSELATNAVLHSRSRDGGTFTLALSLKPGSLRVEVVDGGPPARPAPADPMESFRPGENEAFPYGESGRGLIIVHALADDWGHEQHEEHVLWWAELWTEQP